MVANFGFGVMLLTFVVTLFGIGAAIYGAVRNRAAWVESARLTTLLFSHTIGRPPASATAAMRVRVNSWGMSIASTRTLSPFFTLHE